MRAGFDVCKNLALLRGSTVEPEYTNPRPVLQGSVVQKAMFPNPVTLPAFIRSLTNLFLNSPSPFSLESLVFSVCLQILLTEAFLPCVETLKLVGVVFSCLELFL